MSELCLTLLCPPAVEEKLLDLLLLSPHTAVFTSTPTAAHGQALGGFDQTEQVLGRAFATQVQLVISDAARQPLLDSLRAQFTGAGLRYWIIPVNEAGEIA